MAECQCRECRRLCEHTPGWFAPDQAAAAIAAGHAEKMMLDWFNVPPYDVTSNIFVLSAASVGRGGDRAPTTDELFGDVSLLHLLGMLPSPGKGRCVFYTDQLCAIHATGFKPQQCIVAMGCGAKEFVNNEAMAALWNTDQGRAIVEQWLTLVKFDRNNQQECQ